MAISPAQATSIGQTAAGSTAASATASLTGDFNTFLTLLTTQLQNQDPSNPLDTNQFTSQLVQFANVEQQIKSNTNLNTLIDLSKASSLYQASAMIGRELGVESNQLALQGGTAGLQISLAAPQTVNITISSTSGATLYKTSLDGRRGVNDWHWDGKTSAGRTLPDGPYKVAVTSGADAATAVPFTVVGKATGVSVSGATPTVAIDQISLPMSAIRSVIR